MTSERFRHFTLMAVLLVGMAACGGGTQLAGGGIGGTGISQGSITAFGSVWVNGVEFDTTNAAISRDGSTVAQDDLHIGMVVTIDGSINSDGVSGTGTSVTAASTAPAAAPAAPPPRASNIGTRRCARVSGGCSSDVAARPP